MTFVAAYRWSVEPGKEEQFRTAWRRGTHLIQRKYGSFGSRLHRDEEGRYVGVAEWPDRETWQKAFNAGMEYDDPANRAAFIDALAEGGHELLLLLDVVDDLLDRS